MRVYSGKQFRVSVNDPDTIGTWLAISSAQLLEFDNSYAPVVTGDVSDSAWQSLLSGAGQRNFSLSFSAVRTDEAVFRHVLNASLNRTHLNMRLHFPDGDQLEGDFAITRTQWRGEADGLEELIIRLESSGDVVLTSA